MPSISTLIFDCEIDCTVATEGSIRESVSRDTFTSDRLLHRWNFTRTRMYMIRPVLCQVFSRMQRAATYLSCVFHGDAAVLDLYACMSSLFSCVFQHHRRHTLPLASHKDRPSAVGRTIDVRVPWPRQSVSPWIVLRIDWCRRDKLRDTCDIPEHCFYSLG